MGTIVAPMLSPKEQAFADAYLSGKSAGEADILAGYSRKAARTEGPKRLQKPAIQAYIQAQQNARAAKTLSVKDKISAELHKLAFANIADLTTLDEDGQPTIDFSRATRDHLAAVTSVSNKTTRRYDAKGKHVATEKQAKFTLADKHRGLELLGRLEGLFASDKVEVVVDVADRLLKARQRTLALPAPEDTE